MKWEWLIPAKVVTLFILMVLACPQDRWDRGLGPLGWGPWRLVLSQFALSSVAGWWIACRLPNRLSFQATLPILAILFGLTESVMIYGSWDFPGRPLLLRTAAALSASAWIYLGVGSTVGKDNNPWLGLAALMLAMAPPAAFAWRLSTVSERDSSVMSAANRVVAESKCLMTLVDAGWLSPETKAKTILRIGHLSRLELKLTKALGQTWLSSFDRGVILARLERRSEAIAMLQRVSEPMGRLLLARLIRENGDLAQAESIFRMLEINADKELAWLATQGLAETMVEAGNPSDASNLMESAAERFGDHQAKCLIMAGSMAAESGLGNRALKLWAAAESIDMGLGGEISVLRNRLLANSPACLNMVAGYFH